jgi:hypothetical protein
MSSGEDVEERGIWGSYPPFGEFLFMKFLL